MLHVDPLGHSPSFWQRHSPLVHPWLSWKVGHCAPPLGQVHCRLLQLPDAQVMPQTPQLLASSARSTSHWLRSLSSQLPRAVGHGVMSQAKLAGWVALPQV